MIRCARLFGLLVGWGALVWGLGAALAQDAKKGTPAKEPPKVVLVSDPATAAKKGEWVLRGLHLNQIDKAEFLPAGVETSPLPLKLQPVEKSAPPGNRPPPKAGDESRKLEIKPLLDSKSSFANKTGTIRLHAKDPLPTTVIPWSPPGESTLLETEPNNGPEMATPLSGDREILGCISPNKDVDAVSWVLPPGKTGVILRFGPNQSHSLLEPMVWVHNEQLQLVAELIPKTTQENQLKLGKPGKYYFSIIDINDTDSEFHHYRFRLSVAP